MDRALQYSGPGQKAGIESERTDPVPNLIELAIPGFILLMTIEAVADAVMRRDLYEVKDSAASITMGLGNVAVNLVAKTMQLAIFGLLYQFRLFNLGVIDRAFGKP